MILRDLEARLSPQICGATRFFGGRGDSVGPMWRSFRAALDSFGLAQPQLCADAVMGAECCFIAMQAWFAPFCAARVFDHEPA
jgi:heme oxygenase